MVMMIIIIVSSIIDLYRIKIWWSWCYHFNMLQRRWVIVIGTLGYLSLLISVIDIICLTISNCRISKVRRFISMSLASLALHFLKRHLNMMDFILNFLIFEDNFHILLKQLALYSITTKLLYFIHYNLVLSSLLNIYLIDNITLLFR